MNWKIFYLFILVLILIPGIEAETNTYTGILDLSGSGYSNHVMPINPSNKGIDDVQVMVLHIGDISEIGEPISLRYDRQTFNFDDGEYTYSEIPQNVGCPFTIYDGATYKGNGGMYISKREQQTSSILDGVLTFYFSDDFTFESNTTYNMYVYMDSIKEYYTSIWSSMVYLGTHPSEYSSFNIGISYNDASSYMYSFGSDYDTCTARYDKVSQFRNEYVINQSEYVVTTYIDRNFSGYSSNSKLLIKAGSEIIFDSGYTTESDTYVTLNNESYNYYLVPYYNEEQYYIWSVSESTAGDIILETDKTEYNSSETITITYQNIDEFYSEHYGEYKYEKPYTMHILYPVSEPDKQYETKFMQHLYYDLRDETFTIDASLLSPQTTFKLAIIKDGENYGISTYHLITSDYFTVTSDDQFISTSCNPDGNCYSANGASIEIYYNIDNNSNLYIKDANGNTVNTFYGISGSGTKQYSFPEDRDKELEYPYWKIFLNNTEYETSLSTNVTVYWSLLVEVVPTTPYPVYTPDTNVSEDINELKDGIKPLKDLIFGLATILVDNPDYDSNNIVDESELNNWFNSIIPLGLVVLIYCFYIGLTKRGKR